MKRRARIAAACALLICAASGCARPYTGPKTLAAVGTGLLLVGSAAWIAGERTDRRDFVVPGFVTTAIGVGAIVAAGGWLAASIACEADPDCAPGEECKELPAPPGGVPYRQCVRR